MEVLAELIAGSHARWLPRVVVAILGTDDPVAVADALTGAFSASCWIGSHDGWHRERMR